MNSRARYEQDVLKTFRGLGDRPRLSDEDRDREYACHGQFYTALARFRAEVEAIAGQTELRRTAMQDLIEGLNDLTPNPKFWLNDIEEGSQP